MTPTSTPITEPRILGSVYEARMKVQELRLILDPSLRIVATNGNFDFLHYGHVALFHFCKEQGGSGAVFVAVDDDEQVREQKGKGRPIFPLAERLACVSAIRYVDFVFPFNGDVTEVYANIRPDVLVKGEEWRGRTKGAEYARKALYAPRVYAPSCRDVIERIRKGK